mmetsp:Transcript_52760/g.150361  ORF Transcript_52760/g.150361 Transcript_52760/m.150361 type:complete len:229 (+) Transcript_52760:701-1387(+)
MEQCQKDDVERLERVTEEEREAGQEANHLHGDADAVDHVGLQALEDTPRNLDRGEDRRKPRPRQHNVGRGLGSVRGAFHGDADLRASQGRRIVDSVAGHANDHALLLEHGDHLVLVLRHDLREAVRAEDQLVAQVRGGPEMVVRQDVGAELNLPRELLGNVQMVAGDHLHAHLAAPDLGDGLSRVSPRRVHDWQETCKDHGITVGAHRDGDGLVAALAEPSVGSIDFC